MSKKEGNQLQREERMKGNSKDPIVVAVDDSRYARVVAQEAARLALEKSADVVFLSVIPVPFLPASEGEINAEYLSEEEKKFQDLHKKLIESFFIPNSGILIESKILHGDPAAKIVKYAEEINADLIVVGTRGHGRVASVLLGSVSEKVANNSKRSVLIVKKEVSGDTSVQPSGKSAGA